MGKTATIKLLREVYTGPAWHGPSVLEALAGVTASVATCRLAPDRHSIWDLVLHLAHGRYLVTGRVTQKRSTFPRRIRAPWWPIIDYAMTDAAWRDDLRLLDECQTRLVAAAIAATPKQLARVPKGATYSIADQLVGMAVHDGYHAGQIKQLALEFATRSA